MRSVPQSAVPTPPPPPLPVQQPGPGSTAPAALASDLRVGVLRLARRLRQQRRTTAVSESQLSVLAVLDRAGPLSPRDLAALEGVTPPSMTRTVALLGALGLVHRTPHPTDRRQVLVSLSAAGSAEVAETRRRRDAWLAVRLARLTVAERRTLAAAAEILAGLARP